MLSSALWPLTLAITNFFRLHFIANWSELDWIISGFFQFNTSVIISSFSNLWKIHSCVSFSEISCIFLPQLLNTVVSKDFEDQIILLKKKKNKTYRATRNFINWPLKIGEYTCRCAHIACRCLIHFWLIFTNNEQFKLSIWILIYIGLLLLTSQVISMTLNKTMNCIKWI